MKKRPAPFTFSKGGGRFFQVLEILNLMTLAPIPAKSLKTTCPSKKLKFRPPMEKLRPALRGSVRWSEAPKRPPAFILHFFRSSVHLPLSVVLNSLDGAHRPYAFDTTVSAMSGGLLPSG